MATIRANTVGSSTFDPHKFFEDWAKNDFKDSPAVTNNDLALTIKAAFGLPQGDKWEYHAMATVTLPQAQAAVNAGSAHGLHSWYRDEAGTTLPPPPPVDSKAYTDIFLSTTSTPNSLKGFLSNAKKDSIRKSIATYLSSKRQISSSVIIPKLKTPHVNPYLDLWAWSCTNLEWAGPDPSTPRVRHAHPTLPIFMHHFGCVCPSYESLEVIKQLGRPCASGVLEIGSGNGYWAYMLRRLGVAVTAIDSRQSVYRSLWISDTIVGDGITWIKKVRGASDYALLLVYPIVGGDGFTAKVLDAYKGSTIIVAGTQNENGYTAFKDVTIDVYMKENKSDFEKVVQIPLPSFAGKDEALFVFSKK